METKPTKNTKLMIAVVIVLVLLLAGTTIFFKKTSSNKNNSNQTLPPSQEILPTINPSTMVTLVADARKQNVTFNVNNIPSDVTTIEYEMVYEHDLTKRDIADGAEGTRKEDAAIGTLEVTSRSLTKVIKLGTCSATCTYHTGVKSVKLSLKFLGGKTPSMFEKEFPL